MKIFNKKILNRFIDATVREITSIEMLHEEAIERAEKPWFNKPPTDKHLTKHKYQRNSGVPAPTSTPGRVVPQKKIEVDLTS